MFLFKNSFILVLLLTFLSCGGPELPVAVKSAYDQLPENIDFNRHVKPILSDKCFICHGPDKAKVEFLFNSARGSLLMPVENSWSKTL